MLREKKLPKRPGKTLLSKYVSTLCRFLLIGLVCILALFPVYYMITNSLKTYGQIFARPPVWFFLPTFENYKLLFYERNYHMFFMNSSLIGLISTALTLSVSIPAAYSLAKLNPPRRDDIAFWILSIRMFPPVVALIPLFYIFRTLRLVGSYTSIIIVYQILNIPLSVWMLKSFFREIPREVEDAAFIDGCGYFEMVVRIVLPISKTGIAATGLLCLVFCWNEFLFASVLTQLSTRTLPVAITQFVRLRGVMWGPMSGAALVTVMPVWIISLLVQKAFIRGMSFGAIK